MNGSTEAEIEEEEEAEEVVIIKWGGGLITDKGSLCTVNHQVVRDLAAALKQTVQQGSTRGRGGASRRIKCVLVHGAGSYGHLRCKQWRLNEGLLPKEEEKVLIMSLIRDEDKEEKGEEEEEESGVKLEGESNGLGATEGIISCQRDAVVQVRRDLLSLNRIVCEEIKLQLGDDDDDDDDDDDQDMKNTGSFKAIPPHKFTYVREKGKSSNATDQNQNHRHHHDKNSFHSCGVSVPAEFEEEIIVNEVQKALDEGAIPVLFGDIVDVDEGGGGGIGEGEEGESRKNKVKDFVILSGDDLIARLALRIKNVRRVVFAIGGGVDGIMRWSPAEYSHITNNTKSPPVEQTKEDGDLLLHEWSPNMPFESTHYSNIDVSGGIGLKASMGAYIVEESTKKYNTVGEGRIRVVFVNGNRPERVVAACRGDSARGTEIVNTPTNAPSTSSVSASWI
eukprot:Nk52_evm22s485 gene=Nk52_evmTU22s485